MNEESSSESINRDLVNYRLSKAKETLHDAEIMMANNGSARSTINCLYYSCMYAVLALLHTKNIYAKSHDGIRQMLGLHFIKPGLLSVELGEFYSRLLNRRITGDYDEFITIERSELQLFMQNAKILIGKIESMIS